MQLVVREGKNRSSQVVSQPVDQPHTLHLPRTRIGFYRATDQKRSSETDSPLATFCLLGLHPVAVLGLGHCPLPRDTCQQRMADKDEEPGRFCRMSHRDV